MNEELLTESQAKNRIAAIFGKKYGLLNYEVCQYILDVIAAMRQIEGYHFADDLDRPEQQEQKRADYEPANLKKRIDQDQQDVMSIRQHLKDCMDRIAILEQVKIEASSMVLHQINVLNVQVDQLNRQYTGLEGRMNNYQKEMI